MGHEATHKTFNFVNSLNLGFAKKQLTIQILCQIACWRYIVHEQLLYRKKILRSKSVKKFFHVNGLN